VLRRLGALVVNDSKLAVRNHFLTIIVALALIYVAVILWLIPRELSLETRLVVLDETSDRRITAALEAQIEQEPGAVDRLTLAADRSEFDRGLQSGIGTVGLIATGDGRAPEVELVFQGHENQRTRNLLVAAIDEQLINPLYFGQSRPDYETRVLNPGAPTEKPPFNEALLPIFLFTEAGMLGVFLIAALMFSEKLEGTDRAYSVTPGRTTEFLLSKVLVFGILALVMTAIITVPTVGLAGISLWQLAVVILLASFFTSYAGVVVAAFFDNFAQYVFWGILVMVILGLPAGSYFVPSFSPAAVRIIPTYPFIFALREIYFPTGNPGIVYTAIWQLSLATVVAGAAGTLIFQRRLRGT